MSKRETPEENLRSDLPEKPQKDPTENLRSHLQEDSPGNPRGNLSGNAHSSLRLAIYRRFPQDVSGAEVSSVLPSIASDAVVTAVYEECAGYEEGEKPLAQFERMMKDAARGSFDAILAASVSTFGGNTGDALSAVKRLTERGIGIIFVKEQIDTLSAGGQKLLDIIAVFEKKKRRRHAGKIRQGIQKKFEAGSPSINLNRMIGYDLADDGRTWLINEEQARTVRYIFHSYVEGKSANQIAKDLNEAGAVTVNGRIWRADSIMEVLRNEKYVGDIEMQKTVSIQNRQPVANTGQAPRYYYTNHHAAIIERDLWDRVQAMVRNIAAARPKPGRKGGRQGTVFGSLICGACGSRLKRFGYSTTLDSYTDGRSLAAEGIIGEEAAGFSESYVVAYNVLRCEKKYIGHEGKHGRLSAAERAECDGCPGSIIYHETVLEQSFMEMLVQMKQEYQEKGEQSSFAQDFRAAYRKVYESMGGAGSHYRQIDALDKRIRMLKEELDTVRERYGEILFAQGFHGSGLHETGVYGSVFHEPGLYDQELHEPGSHGLEFHESVFHESELYESKLHQSSSQKPEPHESVADVYARRLDHIRQSIAACEEEKKTLEDELSITITMKQNYDFFIRCLLALPEPDKAGEKRGAHREKRDVCKEKRNREDWDAVQGNLSQVEDKDITGMDIPYLLPFDKSMYLTFFSKGVARGDEIEFSTSFGARVKCRGCSRKPETFLGYWKVAEDGSAERITGIWQIGNRKIQYRRKKKGTGGVKDGGS